MESNAAPAPAPTPSTPSSSSPTAATYKGSCHCGRVTYLAEIDFSTPMPHGNGSAVLSRCNCSICLKSGNLLASTAAGSEVRLTSADGGAGLTEYRFGRGGVVHSFCATCGVRCFLGGGVALPDGRWVPVRRVNVQTLDGRVDGAPMEDLKALKVGYWDVRGEDFGKPMGERPFEGGVW